MVSSHFNIFSELKNIANEKSLYLNSNDSIIRGVYNTEYHLKLNPSHTIFHLNYIIIQTLHQGCCYYLPSEINNEVTSELIGKSVFELQDYPIHIQIAAYDSIFPNFGYKPKRTVILSGSNIQKSIGRTKIVVTETQRILSNSTPKNGLTYSIVNVGVVGEFIEYLKKIPNVKISASDQNDQIINKSVHGIHVLDSNNTYQLISEADIAIVTGMTLATDTLDEIVITARKNNTVLLLFAETGSNFGYEYCNLGIDIVISEPFPFYLVGNGDSVINIFHK